MQTRYRVLSLEFSHTHIVGILQGRWQVISMGGWEPSVSQWI